MKSMKYALAVVIAASLTACGGASPAKESGGMKLVMAASSALASAPINATLSIQGPLGYHDSWTGALPHTYLETPCPVGHYTYSITTSTSGAAKFAGSSGAFDIAAGEVTLINVMLQQNNATPMAVVAPFTDHFVVVGLSAAGKAGWGVPLNLTAFVSHPDNDQPDLDFFHYTWTHSCSTGETKPGSFILGQPLYVEGFWPQASIPAVFLSYCQGVETITLKTVNDNSLWCSGNGCELVSTVSFTIPYDPQGVEMDIAFNYAPVISCDLVNNAEPAPGSEVNVVAKASDPDGAAADLTYQWSTSEGCGSFKEGTATQLSTIWIAPAANCQACVLRLDVTDAKGGSNYGTIGAKTAPADLLVGCGGPVVE